VICTRTHTHLFPSLTKQPLFCFTPHQDINEVMDAMIDRLHEDMNRVHGKPYTENPEGDGTNDEEVADEAWEKHTQRHDSVVRDLVGGMLRSRIECPDCGRVSVAFDPTNTMNLAIPTEVCKQRCPCLSHAHATTTHPT